MPKWASFIVRRRKTLLVAALLLLIPSVFGYVSTVINYDVAAYLPADLPSRAGQTLLEKNFRVATSVFVMVPDMEPWRVAELGKAIGGIAGVERVRGLSDYYHPSVPRFYIPEAIRTKFLTEKSAILQVEFTEGATSGTTQAAITTIRELADQDAAVSGFPVIIKDVYDIFSRERFIYILVAVLAILLILSLSTKSFVEPVLLLLATGFAVVYNLGSNFAFNSVSYITEAVAAVLQLAVTMDYGIFLIHRFAEEKTRWATADEAMVAAVARTGTAIAASALTTVAGFAALVLMRFRLGADLGLVMTKGVCFSLLTTLFILPGLLLFLQRTIDRTRHRVLLPGFERISGWIVRRRRIILALFVILLVPAVWYQGQVDVFYSLEQGLSTEVRGVADSARLKEEYGTTDVAYVLLGGEPKMPESSVVADLKDIPGVKSVAALSELTGAHVPELFVPSDVREQFRNGEWSYVAVELSARQGTSEMTSALKAIEQVADASAPEAYVTGEAIFTRDLKQVTDRDLARVNLISIVAVAVIVALAFRSLVAPVILVLSIEFAIWTNLAGSIFFGVDLYFVTYLVLGAVQLGATVDYAILLTSNYREALGDLAPQEAMRTAIARSGRSILTSCLTLTSATVAVSLLSGIKMAGQMCGMLGVGAVISMIAILFVLPGLLLLSTRLLAATSLGWPRIKR